MNPKTVIASFNAMHRQAYRTLILGLRLVLCSLSLFCFYLHEADESVIYSMWLQRIYISETVLSAVLLSFAGAFLLDVAHKRNG